LHRLPVHPRHPYAGELVYTAFSGSHQDAIKKGFERWRSATTSSGKCPTCRSIRRTSPHLRGGDPRQQPVGKGGVAYLLKADHGLELPRALQVEIQPHRPGLDRPHRQGGSSPDIWTMFCQTYLGEGEIDLVEYRTFPDAHGRTINATILDRGDERIVEGHGSGPLDGFVDALRRAGIADIAVLAYHEHALGAGSDAQRRPMSKPGCEWQDDFWRWDRSGHCPGPRSEPSPASRDVARHA